jgi:hypothetical protein
LVEFAEKALERRDFDAARQMAADAMQLQRILQRAHWNDAVRKLSSPVSSPYAISFQTLPEHWRLINSVKRVAAAVGAGATAISSVHAYLAEEVAQEHARMIPLHGGPHRPRPPARDSASGQLTA